MLAPRAVFLKAEPSVPSGALTKPALVAVVMRGWGGGTAFLAEQRNY
jgi:hypothetical protein